MYGDCRVGVCAIRQMGSQSSELPVLGEGQSP